MEDQEVSMKDVIKEIVGATLGISATLFVVTYFESSSIANGIFWKVIRKLGIAGLGLATMQIVDKNAQKGVDEYITYYSETYKDIFAK